MKNETYTVAAFRGVNVMGETGGLLRAENVCSADYPSLSARGRRAWLRRLSAPQGICGGDTVAYVDNGALYLGDKEVNGLTLAAGEKSMLRHGRYLMIFPDQIYVDMSDTEKAGSMNVYYESDGEVKVCCVDENLEEIEDYKVSSVEPYEPMRGDMFAKLMSDGTLKMHRFDGSKWNYVQSFVKISAPGIENEFVVGDNVKCSGLGNFVGDGFKIVAETEGAIYCEGVIPAAFTATHVVIERSVPLFDLCTVCDGRLFGVRRGMDRDGRFVSRIYASAKNDPFDFSEIGGGACYDVDISEGFTGICELDGKVVIFSENEIIEASIKDGEMSISSMRGCGVEKGAHKSVVGYGEAVYYKSRYGIYRYDGGRPKCISGRLGEKLGVDPNGSAAIVDNGKYCINVTDSNSVNAIYVYVIGLDVWFRESTCNAIAYAKRNGNVYALTTDTLMLMDYTSASEEDRKYCAEPYFPVVEDYVRWTVESAMIRHPAIINVTCTRLALRLKVDKYSTVTVGLRYDGGEVSDELTLKGEIEGVVNVPIVARKSDSVSVVVKGVGEATLIGLALDYRFGGEAK